MPRSSSLLLLFSASALLSTRVLAAAPTISSPNVYQCSPTTSYQITCDDVPCQVVARPEGNPSQSLAVIGTVNTAGASTLPWKASVPEGTSIVVYITDNNGVTGNNSPTVVAQGTGDCNEGSPSSASESASASATESTTAAETSSTSSESTASSESSSSSSAASSESSSSASTSATSPSQSQSTTNTATGTAPASSATPTDAGSGASTSVVGGGLLAGVFAIAAALA